MLRTKTVAHDKNGTATMKRGVIQAKDYPGLRGFLSPQRDETRERKKQ